MLAAVVKSLNATGTRVILCLDEVEALISKEGAQPLYSLTRAMEDEAGENMVSLIVVLRDPEFLKRFDPSTASSLGNTVIHLEEYGFDQLLEILRYRAGEAFKEGVVSDEVLEFISQIASDRRDARYAIELLWRSGKLAELDGSYSITAEHVRKAAASVYPTIRRENLSYLRTDERLILLASARALKGGKAPYRLKTYTTTTRSSPKRWVLNRSATPTSGKSSNGYRTWGSSDSVYRPIGKAGKPTYTFPAYPPRY